MPRALTKREHREDDEPDGPVSSGVSWYDRAPWKPARTRRYVRRRGGWLHRCRPLPSARSLGRLRRRRLTRRRRGWRRRRDVGRCAHGRRLRPLACSWPVEDGVDSFPADPGVPHLVAFAPDDHLARRRTPTSVGVVLPRVDVVANESAVFEEPVAVWVRVPNRAAPSPLGRRGQGEVDRPVR